MRIKHNLILFFSLFSLVCFGQEKAPGGVQGYLYWQSNHDSINQPNSNVRAGNLFSQSLDSLIELNKSNVFRKKVGTLFTVVIPTDSLNTSSLHMMGSKFEKDSIKSINGSYGYDFKFEKPQLVFVENTGSKSWSPQRLISRKDSICGFEVVEWVYYPGILDSVSIRKVETYFALKYGITVTKDDQHFQDYLSSKDSVLWDDVEDGFFFQDVIALGRDDSTGWYASQAIPSDSIRLMVGLDTILPIGYEQNTSIGNNQFVVFGRSQFSSDCSSDGNYSIDGDLWRLRKSNWAQGNSNLVLALPQSQNATSNELAFFHQNVLIDKVPLKYQLSGYNYYGINLDSLPSKDITFCQVDPQKNCPVAAKVVVVNAGDCIDPSYCQITTDLGKHPLLVSISGAEENISFEMETHRSVVENLKDGDYLVSIVTKEGMEVYSNWVTVKNPSSCSIPSEPTKISHQELPEANAYPVPAKIQEKVTVDIKVTPLEEVGWVLVDGYGKVIDQGSYIQKNQKEVLNFSLKIKGVYQLKISAEGNTFTKRILIK